MYISVRDRPASEAGATPGTGPPRRIALTVVLLGVVSLLTDVSAEMVNAVLPLYLTAELGLSLLAYGFVDGLYQGVSALVRILGGYLGDRTAQPKWVATIGYGVSAVSRIAMLPAHGLAAITGVVTADRLGKGLRTAPRDALIASVSDPATLGRSFGVHRALDTVGAAAGPLAAFALLLVVPGSYRSVFVVSFAFALAGVAVIALFVPNPRIEPEPAGRLSPRRLLAELAAPRLRRPLVAAALLGLLTVGDGFLYLSLRERDNLAAQLFPLLYVGTNAAYLALAVPLGRLADRIGRARVLVGGHVALLASYFTAGGPFAGAVWTVASLLLLGTFYAATDGVLPALVSRLAPGQARGSVIAAAQTAVALARFASSVLFGTLWVTLGRQHAVLLLAALLAAAVALAAWLLRHVDAAVRAAGARAVPEAAATPTEGVV